MESRVNSEPNRRVATWAIASLLCPSALSGIIVAEVPIQTGSVPSLHLSRIRLTKIATSAPCLPR